MAKKELVLALFESEAAADAAVDDIKQWDKATKEIKLGSIGVLVKDEKGKVKTHKLGSRHTGTGVLLGVIAAILSGGVSLLGGVVVGGILGGFFHKGLGMSKEDINRIGGELNDGRAAVGVLAKADEADAISAKLAELGGETESHEVSEEAVEEAASAVEDSAELEEMDLEDEEEVASEEA